MSIAELTLTLTVAGILAGLATPVARRGLDALKVRAAREAFFAAAARTRSVALAHSGASLIFDTARRTATISTARRNAVIELPLSQFDVEILTDASNPTITLTYDGRGIGRMASRTIRFRRGRAEAGLTFSSYGRARRW